MENGKKKSSISRNFTEGKIAGPLIRFAVPVLLALFLQAMYGAADLLIVGQFGTSADVSGVSTGSQILMTLTNLISSFAMGTTILLGQQIGEGKAEKGGETIGASICLYFFIGIGVTILTVFGAPALASLMNAPAEARLQTISYIRICGGGTLVIIAYNLIGSIFRGIGDSRTPLITVAIACAANVFGDLLLVAVFHMGTAGAAAATVAAQALSVVISFGIIRKQSLPFAFQKKQIRPVRDVFRRITSLGLPIALQDFLVGISFLVILAIVNALGLVASAGVGVAEKVCAFIMLLPSAFMQAMSAFVAQNAGAGKYDRALRALRSAIALSLSMGILMFYLAFFHGSVLAGIFSKDPQVIAAAADYLKAYAIDCMLTAFLFCFIGFYNGIGMTKFVMIQGILGAFCIRVPVSWLMSRQVPPSLFHIGLATPCSTSVQIVLCLIAMVWTRKHIIAKH